jgi:structural maintenance of chromosome 2
MGNLNFNYTRPHPNFDDSKVKGLVAKLIRLDKEDYNKATALEITAGGKLYNVVVQDERVGKELLQHGRLTKRVTIIPLSKIEGRRMPPQVRRSSDGRLITDPDVGIESECRPANRTGQGASCH